VAHTYQAVRVVEGPPVTLTAAEGQVPVTLTSAADTPLRLSVRMGPTARLEFDDHAPTELVLQPGQTTTLTFAVTAVSAGGLQPVEVVVTDPEGIRVVANGTVVVRSATYSVVALVITAGAAIFLLVWWGRDIAKRRRVRSTEPAERAA